MDPEPYLDVCIYDTCSCESIGDCTCFCDTIAAYAHVCAQHGQVVAWRTPALCREFPSSQGGEGWPQCPEAWVEGMKRWGEKVYTKGIVEMWELRRGGRHLRESEGDTGAEEG